MCSDRAAPSSTASVDGPLDEPVFSGSASIINGRVRHLSLPNALDGINGIIRFDARGIRLDDVSARMGEGPVQFGGRIGFDGYLPGDLNVTVRGAGHAPALSRGHPIDRRRRPVRPRQLPGAHARRHGDRQERRVDAPDRHAGKHLRSGRAIDRPERWARRRRAPPWFRCGSTCRSSCRPRCRSSTNLLRLVASADLTLRGTYDKPVLFGRADIGRGEVTFEGRRYRVTRGAIDFINPNRIEPFFDVEAETTVRVPGGPTQRPDVSRDRRCGGDDRAR